MPHTLPYIVNSIPGNQRAWWPSSSWLILQHSSWPCEREKSSFVLLRVNLCLTTSRLRLRNSASLYSLYSQRPMNFLQVKKRNSLQRFYGSNLTFVNPTWVYKCIPSLGQVWRWRLKMIGSFILHCLNVHREKNYLFIFNKFRVAYDQINI